MSTNKSQNLKLHLWEPEDNFLRTEFNENFAAIDAALKAEEIARAAGVSNALTTAQRAQTTANAALVRPYVTGSYTGTGADMTIVLGFRPSFLFISGMQENDRGDTPSEYVRYNIMSGGHMVTRRVTFTDTGFTLFASFPGNYQFPQVTAEDRIYDYIAFR